MPIAHFERKIQELNFSFISEKGTSGVLLTQNYESLSKAISAPDILFALETAKNKFGADAVYFRYFQDSRAAVPQLYIFDYTLKPLSSQEKNRIHRNMWNIHHHREVICELFRRKRKTRLQQDKLCTRDNHKNRRSH